jgi:hypothetical protein
MTKSRTRTVWVVACAAGIASAAHAGHEPGTLVSQPPNQFNAVWSDDSDSSLNPFERRADSFTLSEPAAIRTVRFWGVYFNDAPFAQDEFTVRFYSNDASLSAPDELVHSTTLQSLTRNATGEIVAGVADEYAYTARLNGAFDALPDQTYWISIINNDGGNGDSSNNSWLWETSFAGDMFDSVSYDGGMTWNQDSQGDLAFELSTVPAPSGATLILAGGLLTARPRR